MRLNHVTLIVTDLGASLRFYAKLGLRPIVLAEPRYARMVFPDGDETLSLEVTREAAQPSRVQLYFECPDLDAVWARLRDPDGHQIRLYHAGVNRLNPPWRIDRS